MEENFTQLFDRQLKEVLERTAATGKKPTLLLHACCAPCSTAVLEKLRGLFTITILYYNPNIYPQAEHDRRRDELLKFMGLRQTTNDGTADEKISVETLPYAPQDFYAAARGLENEREKGQRCFACYGLRLAKAAEYAVVHGFEYFTTVLSISPHKDAKKINEIGKKLAAQKNGAVQFLCADFKKKNGFKRSLEISAQYGLYRQDYCGCEFSIRKNKNSR